MTDRRDVLTALAAGAAAIPAAVLAQQPMAHSESVNPPSSTTGCCLPPGAGGEYFPNVAVQTHDGQRALFYNDLLHEKIVLVNFMSVKNDAHYPVTANLTKVQRLLGDRVGRDVFMYSITVDPEHDTPEVLAEFAQRNGAQPGWLFLTGEPNAVDLIKDRFFVHGLATHGKDDGHPHDQGNHHGATHDCSMGLVRYGNVSAGVWGSVAAKADPAQIVDRLSWVSLRPVPQGAPRRRGPARLNPRMAEAIAKLPAKKNS
jgi:protein SCO1/2